MSKPMKYLVAAVFGASLAVGAQASCYQQLKQRLPQAGTIIFGEPHGSAEIPRFFFECAREFAENKESIRIFLEFQASENLTVEKFMRAEIGEDELIKAPHWSRQDGRSSLAMLGLFRDLKSLPVARLAVVGFDLSGNEPDREKAMLGNFMTGYSVSAYNLVLTGNMHARLSRGTPWNPDLVPFARHLKEHVANVISLDAHYPAGSAWMCAPVCGATPLNPTGAGKRPAGNAQIVYSAKDPAFSGYFRVDSITASRPVFEK
jgi:hypothetical protein